MRPRIEQDLQERPQVSPLWPLVLLLAEIAARVERQQVAESRETPPTRELAEDAAVEGAVS